MGYSAFKLSEGFSLNLSLEIFDSDYQEAGKYLEF